jgi:hypothetical protein
MDDYLQNKASVGSDFVISLTTNNALVFNQSATDVDNYGFNESDKYLYMYMSTDCMFR